MTMFFPVSHRCFVGHTAIITGGNSGIGFKVALEFAKRAGRVILASRNVEKSNKARDQIIDKTNNLNVVVKHLDLESLESVRNFAEDIHDTEQRVDVLVNHASVGYLPNKLTQDSLQRTMTINYFGPFLLTNLLIDLLQKSHPSRVVNVSDDIAMLLYHLNLQTLNTFEDSTTVYARSKLCNICFTKELARREEGTGITAYSMGSAPEHGDQMITFLALKEGIEKFNGEHFLGVKPSRPYLAARDMEKNKKLWEITRDLVGFEPKKWWK